MPSKLTILGLACAAQLWFASGAHALDLYAGLLGGYGFTSEEHELEPYGPAFGGKAGLTLLEDMPFYLGARLVWFAGDTGDLMVNQGQGSATVEISESYLTYGVDLGYDLELGPLVLRPQLGIGGATLYRNRAGTEGIAMEEASEGTLYLAPAAEALLALGLIYAGVEIRYMGLTASQHLNGVVMLVHAGLTI